MRPHTRTLSVALLLALALLGMAQVRVTPSLTGPTGFPANFTLTTSVTQVCTAADTTETDLWSYSLPANTLSTDGRGVRVTAWGSYGATANSKVVKVYFGASVINGSFSTASNNGAFRIVGEVLRTGAAAQVANMLSLAGVLSNASHVITTPAETMSGAVTIRVTGTNVVAAANDICIRGAILETLR